eukprot:11933053-Karenia_brevis.AAC.1
MAMGERCPMLAMPAGPMLDTVVLFPMTWMMWEALTRDDSQAMNMRHQAVQGVIAWLAHPSLQ